MKKDFSKDLEFQKLLLKKLQENSGIGVWVLFPDTGEVYWSERVFQIHEYKGKNAPELDTAIKFYHKDSLPIITKAVNEAIENKKGWDLELKLVTAKKNVIWVRTVGSVLIEKDKADTIFGTFEDITKRKEQMDQLERANNLMIGREEKMIELKDRINQLEEKLKINK